ncbi:MAG: integration host factor subunit beta [Bacteroidia bacterium]|nr:integration host factor subunit beta [Bacteroidia bacterium]
MQGLAKLQFRFVHLHPNLGRQVLQNQCLNKIEMTKAEIVNQVADATGVEKVAVQATVEATMKAIKDSLSRGENVYLRGFGSFIVKKRAEKKGRNISKNTTIIIPAHNIPSFKPAKVFMEQVKKKVK